MRQAGRLVALGITELINAGSDTVHLTVIRRNKEITSSVLRNKFRVGDRTGRIRGVINHFSQMGKSSI